jgi:hypothetical protein
MLGFFYGFMSTSVSSMILGVQILGACIFKIVISSSLIVSFINMKWPSLSLLNNFVLESAFSDII